jgi:hypothetical protein
MKVQIISISWGIGKDSPSIATVVHTATKRGILIFASASNRRAADATAFSTRYPSTFCIGAADGLGAPSTFNPPCDGEETYSALGEAVMGAYPAHCLLRESGTPELWIRRDGTSIATPVAAGIAALLIDYTWQFMDRGNGAESYENMRKLLIEMSKSTVGKDYRYLAPWYLFEAGKQPRAYIKRILSAPPGKCQFIGLKALTIFSIRSTLVSLKYFRWSFK